MRPRLILARITAEAGDEHWRTSAASIPSVTKVNVVSDRPNHS
jgi:hypothetical protein